MKAHLCPRETDLWDAIAAGSWPDAAEGELRAHVASCSLCQDLALVAVDLRADAAVLRQDATPPSSAIVWWRAQMRARQEAARTADRPISIVQAFAIACAAGLALGLLGTVIPWVRGSAAWLGEWSGTASSVGSVLATIDLTSRWVLLPALLILASLVIMPIAFYAIVSDE